MADEATTTDAPEAAATDNGTDDAPDADTGGWDEDKFRATLTKKNQEAKSLRQRLKELEPLAAKARELEEASKSEQQKLAEALEAEKAGRSAAEQRLLRFEVGAEKGVPAHLMRFLTGNTREEIEDAADVLVKEIGNGKPAKTPGKGPERVAGGAPSSPDDDLNPVELIRKVREGRI